MNSTPSQTSAPLPSSEFPWGTTDTTRTALLDALNELLEAERAGARVAMETGRSITDASLAGLVGGIHKDEIRWCTMLMRTIKSLGGTPSSATGAFHGRAMAISDLDERLQFLNRGQAWVTRKLQDLIPKFEGAQARADLTDMLQAHQQNISRVEARYSSHPTVEGTTTAQSETPPLPSEPAALIEYILARFHNVHRRKLPELNQLAAKVEAVHANHAAAPRGLTDLLKSMHNELLEHMEKEEAILFPMLARGGNPFVVHPIGVMRAEHAEQSERLAQLIAMTRNATAPEDACTTWRRLSASAREFVDDLQQHIQLENDVLFPPFESPRS